MTAKPSYVVLVMRGDAWEAHGPLAVSYSNRHDAEGAARTLSARFPQRTFGVYQLQTLFGTEQRVTRQKVKAEEPHLSLAEQRPLYKIHAAE